MNDSKQRRELSLDPAGNEEWSEFRALAHVMVDDMIDHLSSLAAQPAWRPMPASVRRELESPIPARGCRRRNSLPGLSQAGTALPQRKSPPSVLGLGAGATEHRSA